jgi:hypothetical protein
MPTTRQRNSAVSVEAVICRRGLLHRREADEISGVLPRSDGVSEFGKDRSAALAQLCSRGHPAATPPEIPKMCFLPRPPRVGAEGGDGVRRGCSEPVRRLRHRTSMAADTSSRLTAPSTVDGHRAGRCWCAEHSHTSAAGASCVSDPTAAMGPRSRFQTRHRPCGSRGTFPRSP